jgi:hypothetical protein
MKLASECPEFMKMVVSSETFKESKAARTGKTEYRSLSGTLVKVVPGEFSHFLIKDQSGKTEKIWWMEYFPGADMLSDPKNLNGNVKLKYEEKEVYNGTLKDYVKIKVAVGLEK